jgi:outer membrane protein OmpU
MKKVLLGTTAIVAAGMIASAPSAIAAEKIKLSVGGYMEQWFGFVSNDDGAVQDYSGFDVKSDAEVQFKGKTTLDNGISVGVNVQLEANSNPGDQIDESYIILKGGFGEINIGSENSAQYKMHYAPSDFGIGMNSGDQTGWVSTLSDPPGVGGKKGDSITEGGIFRGPYGSTYVEVSRANDSEKITYYTPRVEGFQLGVSYSPDTAQDSNGGINRDTQDSDLVMGSVNFNRKFGSTTVKASVGYGAVTDGPAGSGSDPSALNVGLVLGFGGFGFGASYAQFEDTGANTGEGLNVGVNYASGPWGVSLAYFHGERDGTGSVGADTLDGNAEMDTIHLSAKYALGPGVTAAGTLGYTEFSSDDVDLDADVKEVAATYLVVGLKVSF